MENTTFLCFHGISILQASFANEKIRILKTKARPTFSTENCRINRCGSLVLVWSCVFRNLEIFFSRDNWKSYSQPRCKMKGRWIFLGLALLLFQIGNRNEKINFVKNQFRLMFLPHVCRGNSSFLPPVRFNLDSSSRQRFFFCFFSCFLQKINKIKKSNWIGYKNYVQIESIKRMSMFKENSSEGIKLVIKIQNRIEIVHNYA